MKRCNRCVMDDVSDSRIHFDENGVCNYCTDALKEINTITYFPNEEGQLKLEKLIEKIKNNGKNKQYDCVMGLSGGLDSSYLAYLGYKWGLRILAVHIDDGYDTPITKENLARLCKAANIDLKVIKPDSVQYNNLILAYMKAGVPNLAIPQDNVLFAFLFDVVKKYDIKYFLSGGNFALECVLQNDHVFNSMDVVNIKDINRRFGLEKTNKLKFISSYRKYIRIKLGKVITLRPLDFIDYNKKRAFDELYSFCGYEYYGAKHLENILTAFIQLYWFPKKYGVDKRKSHLSSMIVSGQMTREEALLELEKPMCDGVQMEAYIEYIIKQLGITRPELDSLVNAPSHEHEEYKYDKLSVFLRKFIK